MLSLVVARGRDGAIGKAGTIPWRAPEDLAFFQRETLGGAVIMGRRTWVSLPVKPLKGRLNIVMTSRELGGVAHFSDVLEALGYARDEGYSRIYGIGGAHVYGPLLPIAHRLLITEVDTVVPEADAYFPDFDPSDWRQIAATRLRAADPRCDLVEYLRRDTRKDTT